MVPGAFCLFHDYNDPRNLPGIESYGVYQGVRDGLPKDEFDFFIGCPDGIRRFGAGMERRTRYRRRRAASLVARAYSEKRCDFLRSRLPKPDRLTRHRLSDRVSANTAKSAER
jgi:hypothetical protein